MADSDYEAEYSTDQCKDLINHIFLPPQLPHEDDRDHMVDDTLLQIVCETLQNFGSIVSAEDQNHVQLVLGSISLLNGSRGPGQEVAAAMLLNAFAQLGHLPPGTVLPLHIRAQNAAILFSKRYKDILIEAFELSPTDKIVMSCKGRLSRTFPGPGVAVSLGQSNNPELQTTLAAALSKMSFQEAVSMIKPDGAGSDTIHPGLVTELVLGFLQPYALPNTELGPRIIKHTRDEVLSDGIKPPWRRSPLWLCLRVVVQLMFTRACKTPKAGLCLYKRYMIHLLSAILGTSVATDTAIASDMLHFMSAKITRRIYKLGLDEDDPVTVEAERQLKNTQKVLDGRWESIQEQNKVCPDLPGLLSLSFSSDIGLSFPIPSRFLSPTEEEATPDYAGSLPAMSRLYNFQATMLPQAACVLGVDNIMYNLCGIELWVERYLQEWVERTINKRNKGKVCQMLHSLLKIYHKHASKAYMDDPEATSVMLLTLLEIWIACDRFALKMFKTLKKYSPEIPYDRLKLLVLPQKEQMARLFRVEGYLEERRSRATMKNDKFILGDFGQSHCFGVQYFKDPQYKILHSKIIEEAEQKRRQKDEELETKQEAYRQLMQKHDAATCTCGAMIQKGVPKRRCADVCPKCGPRKQAKALEITPYEWPLPQDEDQQKVVVFELNPPPQFCEWRDSVAFMLFDVLGSSNISGGAVRDQQPLAKYAALKAYFPEPPRFGRVCLSSDSSPIHRKARVEQITREAVCLENSMEFHYFDDTKKRCIGHVRQSDAALRCCTYRLPEAAASALEPYLLRTFSVLPTDNANSVIARLSDCPKHMTLSEYRHLAGLLVGHRLQWMTLLVQLACPSIDMKKEETVLCILQAIYQAGPQGRESTVLRESHMVLCEKGFASKLLEAVDQTASRIEKNWESMYVLSALASVTTRVLSLVPTTDVVNASLSVLSRLRRIGLCWLTCLEEKYDSATDEENQQVFLVKVWQVAVICAATFPQNINHLETILSDPDEASVLILSSIRINENSRTAKSQGSVLDNVLYNRWKKLSYMAYPIICERIKRQDRAILSCLDKAVELVWTEYRPGSNHWSIMFPESDYWTTTDVEDTADLPASSLSYNILTGNLLADGHPFSQLPPEYMNHPDYQRLFGPVIFRVLRSKVPGFRFALKHQYLGHAVHLGMSGRTKERPAGLLVRAEKDSHVYRLIPEWVFGDKLPLTFVQDYVHWFNVDTKTVEFRKKSRPWQLSAKDSWFLTRDDDAVNSWQLSNNGHTLVSPSSETGRVLAAILSPLLRPDGINLVLDSDKETLTIDLPRLQQSFHLTKDTAEVRSHQCRGFQIDGNQDIGTLIGLKNKLVLHNPITNSRRLIVPEGPVKFERGLGHTVVSVDMGKPATTAHTFKVNPILGRLETNGSLESMLYLCYLHGLTSYCLRDPLTDLTGSEQALTILRCGAVASSPVFERSHIEMLEKIAALTPPRDYCSAISKTMENVTWNASLAMLSQHPHYKGIVYSLRSQNAKTASLYYPERCKQPSKPSETGCWLTERAASRSSLVREDGFGAEGFLSDDWDLLYESRDLNQEPGRRLRVVNAALMLFNDRRDLQHSLSCPDIAHHLWKNFTKITDPQSAMVVYGMLSRVSDAAGNQTMLSYDSQWLEDHPDHWRRLWCWLHRQVNAETLANRVQLAFWLATMAFSDKADMDVIQVVAAILAVPEMRNIDPPSINTFNVADGVSLTRCILPIIEKESYSLNQCPESSLPRGPGEADKSFATRKKEEWTANRIQAVEMLARHLEEQWPCRELSRPPRPESSHIRDYINIGRVMNIAQSKCQSWLQNMQLYEYLKKIETVISKLPVTQLPVTILDPCPPEEPLKRDKAIVGLDNIFSPATVPTTDIPGRPKLDITSVLSQPPAVEDRPCLEAVVQRLESKANSSYEAQYTQELRASLSSLQSRRRENRYGNRIVSISDKNYDPRALRVHSLMTVHLVEAIKHAKDLVQIITQAVLSNLTWHGSLVLRLRHGPCLSSAIVLLQQLHFQRWHCLPEGWKKWIVAYGLALTEVQRARRIVQLRSHGGGDFLRELQNEGHTNWEAIENPEALLLEIESDMLIRGVQEDIAQQMSNPPGMKNTVMQLNMGEGKSSVIVPLVATAAADGTRLARVIVAKPQSRQMFHMLVSKLGGLLNRRIFHLPFSRRLRLKKSHVQTIHSQCMDCIHSHGVLLVQPEHLLSLQLMVVETRLSGQEEVSSLLLDIQRQFDLRSRDVVDESDENFSVKFELAYTIGNQRPIEFCPDRWIVIQTVLGFIQSHLATVEQKLPLSIEIHRHSTNGLAGFPRLRLLKQDAEDLLLHGLVARDICDKGFPGFPSARQSASSRAAIWKYITHAQLGADDIASVEQGPLWQNASASQLLLLRGLFAGGVLSFVFGQNRWRVNYGLDGTRKPPTKLAVPFRAKDQPSARSEYSHPDVIILLTCACYYYQGLEDADLALTFRNLLDSDQADIEYQVWVDAADDLPAPLRQLMGINLQDTAQCQNDIFPSFRYSKPAIDYFLRTVVFPKQMHAFPLKLSASGWDLAKVKPHPTTGFSGTIDARWLLPLDMTHLDLPEQKHTNALVLEHLLQPENRVIILPGSAGSVRDSPDISDSNAAIPAAPVVSDLLILLENQNDDQLRVILDVGAQVLELTNEQVAEKWLAMKHTHNAEVEAAVYFNDGEEMMVLDYKGNAEPLRLSPYADQLDRCLVFLDEAHTRGTDLRLPETYRAAVTLGAKVTKDRLIQACMRMRKLGNGQSVLFCVPQDIQSLIRDTCQKEAHFAGTDITVADVLVWAIGETHEALRRHMPLWAAQGRRYEKQRVTWENVLSIADDSISMTHEQATALLEDEELMLEQRYRPTLTQTQTEPAVDDPMCVDTVGAIKQEEDNAAGGVAMPTGESRLQAINCRCAEVAWDPPGLNSSFSLDEEQERELALEVEEERQAERPQSAKPAYRHIDEDLKQFVETGQLELDEASGKPVSSAFLPAFEGLRRTTAAPLLDVDKFPADVLITADFITTIVLQAQTDGSQPTAHTNSTLDAYQRPVQWILTTQPKSWDRVVIISPNEAQALLPLIRSSGAVTLHVYSTRPNLEILPLDHLNLFTVPARPFVPLPPIRVAVLLNLFAGQLYLSTFDEYVVLCEILGLSWQGASDGMDVAADGFILSPRKDEGDDACSFAQSPVPFLKVFMKKIRRDGQSIDRTHLGKILDGVLMQKKDFAKHHWGE